MSQENAEFVRSLYAAFSVLAGGGDVPSFVAAYYDPDCVYEPIEEEEAVRGHDALGRWIERWFEVWDEFRVQVDELVEAGDGALFADVSIHARGAGSGIAVDQRFFHVWDFRGGKALRQQEYVDRDKALSAVGLSE